MVLCRDVPDVYLLFCYLLVALVNGEVRIGVFACMSLRRPLYLKEH